MNSTVKIDIDEFLERAGKLAMADVRSPKEFEQGHIPGAFNLPLFENEERAIVGTIYHMAGREQAIEKGLQIVGPRLKDYVAIAKNQAVDGQILLHCWRGGMRSDSLAWLLQLSGLRPSVLEGGYKKFRKLVIEELQHVRPLIVLGGMTGSGKTDIIRELRKIGMQVIDLEKKANHKGSVFGALGQPQQPSQEQFENDLGFELLHLKENEPVFIEDESIHIGRIGLPKPFYTRMKEAPMICIELEKQQRAERIYSEYACFDREFLAGVTQQLNRRMGGDRTQFAVKMIREGKLMEAILSLLEYYDKTYSHALLKRDHGQVHRIALEGVNSTGHAVQVAAMAKSLGLLS